MKNLIAEAPSVAEAFFALTASIRERSVLLPKQNELILIGIFTASKAMKGLVTHITRALEAGANKDEIISAIVLALPITGIANVNMALDTALETIQSYERDRAVCS